MPSAFIQDIYPLSSMQQGMLFHSIAAPATGLYIEQLSIILRGNLNILALEQAWQQITDQHSILRTSFHWDEVELPLQVVYGNIDVSLTRYDLRGLPTSRQREAIKAYLADDRTEEFDLAEAPLARFVCFQLNTDDCQLVWSYHHMLLDGWSTALVLNKLFECYIARCRGETVQLRPVRPYQDYIEWLLEQDMERAETFWRRFLRGFTAPTMLGIEHDTLDTNFAQEEQVLLVSPEQTSAVQQFVREQHLTLNTVLQGLWALVLSKYSGEQEVVFGTVVSGRPSELVGVESMVGLFINTLPVRVRIRPEQELLAWFQDLQQQQSELRQYEYSPLAQIQTWSDVPAGVPLFESLFVFENYPMLPGTEPPEKGAHASIEMTAAQAVEQTHYPLNLIVIPGSSSLQLKLLFAPTRFSAVAMQDLLHRLNVLLGHLLTHPQQRLGHLSLLSVQERALLVGQGQRRSGPYPAQATLSQLFEEQVAARPEAIALGSGEQQVSYTELDRRASSLAVALRAGGVDAEVGVGICLERSVEQIIGLLGILKAGGYYVPLEPTAPLERQRFLIQDAHVRLILSTRQHGERLMQVTLQDVPIWSLDAEDAPWLQKEKSPVECVRDAQALAYVLYTSGSTGRPKGVSVSQQAVVRLVKGNWFVELDEREVVLYQAPLAFDASTLELWGSLLNGARLIIGAAELQSVEALGQQLQEEQVSTLWLTAGLFHQMVEAQLEILAGVRQVLAGGDVLGVEQVRALLEVKAGRGVVINGYGPTENTTFTCCYPMQQPEQVGERVPIGYPVGNTTVYVLDEMRQLVAAGVVGELYTGGAGLARGYQEQAEQTAEHFVPDPFGQEAGGRLYRTGDLVWWREDGRLEFVGRRDNQVKVRGYRIELGEVELALREQEAVSEAVVIAENQSGSKRLVAYVVPREAAQFDWKQVREALQRRLSEYMLPAVCVQMDQFSLTPNGKVDRRALPGPDMQQSAIQQEYRAPRTETEEQLTQIWQQVLGVQKIGVRDDFFLLGGHSLLATQIISRIRQMFLVDLRLRVLFDDPTIEHLAACVDQFAQQDKPELQPLVRSLNRTGPIPLSFAQQRLWFLEQLEPGLITYTIVAAVRLFGPLRPLVLAASLSEIMQRHEVLRTTFHLLDGQPLQVISSFPKPAAALQFIDLRGLPEGTREQELHQQAQELVRLPFDLSQGPLLRTRLLRAGTQEHVLLLTMHHSISDGWSMGVFTQELVSLYAALNTGAPSPLQALPLQYADYALWQREWLQGAVLEEQLTYWKTRLADLPAPLALPTDHPRSPVQTFRGGQQLVRLETEIVQGLKRVAQQEDATLFMVLLAAFQILLAGYSGQQDIVVGTPIANRTRAEVEPLIGFFVNTLVMRTDLAGQPTYREVIRQVRDRSLEAYSHQEVPFEQVVEAVQPERDLSRSPLFQVMFALQNTPQGALQFAGLRLEAFALENETAKFDLTLSLMELGTEIVGSLEYNSDLFDAETIARMGQEYEALIARLLAQPEVAVERIGLLTDSERQQVFEDWNATRQDWVEVQSVPVLLQEQARQFPETIALAYAEQQVSYGELNRRANQLAHRLRREGVGPETAVAVCLERSIEQIIGLVGILKAGGYYVPLDPASPSERLTWMVQDAQVSVVLTRQHLQPQLETGPWRCLYLDRDWSLFAAESVDELEIAASWPEQLAYVIYTSGSTGVPKGVQISQRSLLNLIFWHQQTYNIDRQARMTQIAGLAFDASVWETWPALTAGALLAFPTEEVRLSPWHLQYWLLEQQITSSFVPTPLAERLLELPWPATMALKDLLTGGDTLQHAPHQTLVCRLINHYGPTEATVVASAGQVFPAGESAERAPLIGGPIANTRLYVLGQGMQVVPIGAMGDLYIAGVSLARGYLGRPEWTAERFVPDPFGQEPGARLYGTGDRVRWHASGQLEFIGRTDHQVKIRGFRIELGEIERVLHQQPQVREAVVIAQEGPTQELQRLVAYVVPNEAERFDWKQIREELLRHLPDYMVPALCVEMNILPLTPNGKIDRRVLAARKEMHHADEQRYVMPHTAREEQLVHIWRQVLGVERIGIYDNFFELGGDSILSIQLVARARQQGIRMTPRQLFQQQTIAELAAVVQDLDQAILPVEQGPAQGSMPLTPIQRWFFEQEQPEPWHWNQSVLLQMRLPLDRRLFQKALTALMRQHDGLRLHFWRGEEGWQQEYRELGDLPFTQIDLSSLAPSDQSMAQSSLADTFQANLYLEQGPLWHAVAFTRGKQEHERLLLICHHLMVDGVSWRILLEDLEHIYSQLAQGEVVHLPAKTSSWQRWAVALERYAQVEPVTKQLAYWQQQLAHPVAALPLENCEGENTIASAAQIGLSLSVEETHALLQEVPQVYHTQINDVLLTTLVQTLQHWTGAGSWRIALEGHGRESIHEELDLSRTIGWFTTLYPVVLNLPAGAQEDPGRALKAIKEQLRAIPEQGLGYGLLRYLCTQPHMVEQRTSWTGGRNAQISFNYLGQFDQSIAEAQSFSPSAESGGLPMSPQSRRQHLLDVTSSVSRWAIACELGV